MYTLTKGIVQSKGDIRKSLKRLLQALVLRSEKR
jgi:hypothetical protein